MDRERVQSVAMVPHPLYAGGAMAEDNTEYDSRTSRASPATPSRPRVQRAVATANDSPTRGTPVPPTPRPVHQPPALTCW